MSATPEGAQALMDQATEYVEEATSTYPQMVKKYGPDPTKWGPNTKWHLFLESQAAARAMVGQLVAPPAPTPSPAPSGSVIFSGLAKDMESLVGHEVTASDPYTTAVHRADGTTDYYVLSQKWIGDDDPAVIEKHPKWDGLNFTHDDISLAADSHYGKIFNVRCAIGDSNAWQPPGSFLTAKKGAAQVSVRRTNDLGKWGYYALGASVPSWSGDPAALQWFDFISLGYQTSRGDQFAFRLIYDSASPTKLSWAVEANVGYAADPSVFNADHRWQAKIMPVTFGQRDEWAFAIKWATDDTGAVQIYHRVAGGTWSMVFEKLNTPTYLYGTTTYGTFAKDGSNWTTVIDKLGAYFGVYPGGTVENVKETGLVHASDLATAQATFPA